MATPFQSFFHLFSWLSWDRAVMSEVGGRCTSRLKTAKTLWWRCCLLLAPHWMRWVTRAMASRKTIVIVSLLLCFVVFSISCTATILWFFMRYFKLMVWQRLRPHTVACGRIQWPGSCSPTATHSHRRYRLCPQKRREFLHHEVMKFKANMHWCFLPPIVLWCWGSCLLWTYATCAASEQNRTYVGVPRRNPARLCSIQRQCARARCFGSRRQRPRTWSRKQRHQQRCHFAVGMMKQTAPRPDAVAHRRILRGRCWCGTAPCGRGSRRRCGQWRL